MAARRRCSSWALPALLVAAVARHAAAAALSAPCMLQTTEYTPYMQNVSSTKQSTWQACQVSCAITPGCAYFTFNYKTFTCSYAGALAKPVPNWRMNSGAAVCPPAEHAPVDPCSNEVARDGFPGVNAAASNSHWRSGKQPESLQCWPKEANGDPAPCEYSTVIEDSANGWPGQCRSMPTLTNVPSCDESCEQNPECQSWSTSHSGTCYQGLGLNCYLPASWKPQRAQRLLHGTVRVLMNMTGWQLQGLTKVWDPFGDGYFKTNYESTQHCKLACYSDIHCQYWSYSSWYGCWIETKEHRVQYPLTLSVATRNSKFAQTSASKSKHVVFGEMIQHICEKPTEFASEGWPKPYCALENYAMTPLDGTNSTVVTVANALLCQERCQATLDCQYYTFVQASGQCHMENYQAQMVFQEGYQSGPKDCPQTTPYPNAQCYLHSGCNALGETGECCPNMDGEMMKCCDFGVAPTVAPPAGGGGGGGDVVDKEDHSAVESSGVPEMPYAEVAWTIPNVTFAELSTNQQEDLISGYAQVTANTLGIANGEVLDLEGNPRVVTISQIMSVQYRRLQGGPVGSAFGFVLSTAGGHSVVGYQQKIMTDSWKQDIMLKTMDVLNPGGALGSVATPMNALKGWPYVNGLSVIGRSQAEIDELFGGNFWTEYGWLLGLLLLLCCLCAIAAFFCLRGRKGPRTGPDAEHEFATASSVEPKIEDDLVEELLNPGLEDDLPAGGVHDVGDSRLPFPEAGLPNRSHLPFPDAGLPQEHGNPETEYLPQLGHPRAPVANGQAVRPPFPQNANLPFPQAGRR
eukprot:TRINITY_DN948_c0_g2_i1.p1 TRINITY_DN948_c0_g2~~TRINITY_DN948_c0_g2_i1.p1  ORF type:complete len:823 (-),score=129.79 TRINITY_DN948_c0_g2_i1:219-2624(-)